MSRHFTCPQGHQWELSDTSSSLSAHLDPVCPTCGAPAQASAPDLVGKSDSGIVRLSLGPAPVESKARVPAPLPVREASVPPAPPVPPRPRERVTGGKLEPPATPRLSQPREEFLSSAEPKSWVRSPWVAALVTAACFLPILFVVGFVSPRARIAEERRRAEEAHERALGAEVRAVQRGNFEEANRMKGAIQLQAAEKVRDEAIEQREQAKLAAERAENARRDADRKRQEQADLREQALVAAKVAEQARDEAIGSRKQAEGRLAHLYAGQGMRSMERGELLESFAWLAEALRLAPSDPAREAPQRMRLAAILTQCPRPLQAWFHDQPVTHAEFSPDGKRVLTVAKDGKARLYDATTGKAIGEALAAGGEITSAHFSRDGKRILTAAADTTARIWDATTAKPITPPLEHTGPILALALSPDGKQLHAVARDTTTVGTAFYAWDAASGDSVGEPWEFTHPVQAAAFTPDGRQILTVGLDGRAYLTDLTGKNSSPVFEQGGPLRQVSFSDDGQLAATCGDKTARVWSIAKREAVSPPLLHPDAVSQVSVAPDGRRAVTACADRMVRVWDVATGQRLLTLRQATLPSTTLFSPDGRHLLTAGQDGIAHVWDVESGDEAVPTLWHGGPIVAGATFSPDGSRVLAASGKEVRVWDLTAGEPLATASDKSSDRVVHSPDGKYFVRVMGDSARIFSVESGKPIGDALKHRNDISLTTFSADGRRLLTVAQKPGQDSADVEVRVWDTATAKAVGPAIELLSLVQQAALSPDGARAATATAAQKVHLWDCATGKEIGVPLDPRQSITHLVFSPDGGKLVSATATGEVRVTDPTNGDPLAPPMKHSQGLSYLAVTPDSKRLVTATANGTAQVLDATTGETLAGPFAHGAAILDVTLSEEGSRAATAGTDGAAHVWDAKTGKAIGPALHHDNAVARVAFSPDGRWLATASGDRVRLWDTATGEPLGPAFRPWRGGATVTQLAFVKEGQLVAGHGQPGDPRARHLLHLTAEARPTAELTKLASVLTGHALDAAGAFTPTDVAEMRKAWDALRAKSPNQFALAPERLLAWHARGADECEQNKQWAGVLMHVERLAELEPKRWEHRARRARTFAALERWQDAASEYRKAMETDPDRPELLTGMARAEMQQKKWQSATEWLDKAVKATPDDRELWALRGQALAELGKLDKAAADFDKAMSLGSNDAATWHQRTLLRLAAGDLEGYRKACLRLVRRFSDSDDATTRLVAWTCGLGPEALADLKPVLRRAERAVTANSKSAPHLLALSALLYRSGQFAPASQRLEEVVKLGGEKPAPATVLLTAMVEHRLGRAEDAKKTLAKAVKPDDAALAALPWDERVAYQQLYREAEALVKSPK
jgi:WD40 repeat protein/Flp pilus assembly protein TadD